MARLLPFIPYPSINNHGVTGDRRTAALIAADGTIDWMCVPDYDGASIFGVLLDAERGGFWRLGPSVPITGTQGYLEHSPAVRTHWGGQTGELEVIDLMVWPEEQRRPDRARRRVLVRQLRCVSGNVAYAMHLRPRYDFDNEPEIQRVKGGASLSFHDLSLGLWTSFDLQQSEQGIEAAGSLHDGEEAWAVLALGEDPGDWNADKAKHAFEETVHYWNDWQTHLTYQGPRSRRMEHSGLIIHLLGYAPEGSLVASPTTSLPERVGGQHNYDYRFAWVRDASLSIAGLALLGDNETSTRYLDWLATLKSSSEMPLQVVYHISGSRNVHERHRTDITGYRGSLPVRFGNRAVNQVQLGSLGYFCDCALIHLEQGGQWKSTHWELVKRVAEYTARHWREPDSGIWELPQQEQYTSSKVMSWVVLDRALKIAQRTGYAGDTGHTTLAEHTGHAGHTAATDPEMISWKRQRDAIFEDVMEHGWSEHQQSFVQRYGSEALDGSLLLIPVMGFLPANHPRTRCTVERIVEKLSIDGLVYRFEPLETPVEHQHPMGEFEGSFLPCTFWLATAYALAGHTLDAENILRRVESLTEAVGLFSEEADARNNELLGNYPLLFSQVEYVRAVLALDHAREGKAQHAGAGHAGQEGQEGHDGLETAHPPHRPAQDSDEKHAAGSH